MPPAWFGRSARCGALIVALGACSKDELRDQNYGKDVGVGYQLPDGAAAEVVVRADAGDAANGSNDATADAQGETGSDRIASSDGGQSTDTSTIDVSVDVTNDLVNLLINLNGPGSE
jgi:hypothetical protein